MGIFGKKYTCEVCASEFGSKEDLFSHRGTHSLPRKNVCPRCGADFLSKEAFEEHMQSAHLMAVQM
jgi:rubredoxin